MAVRGILFLALFTGMCVADPTENLALGAPAVQSSTYHGFGAEMSVDGNRDSNMDHRSCSHTNGDMDAWWRVDLLDVYNISRVVITNRGGGYSGRIRGSQIRIGNSLDNNGNSNELAAEVVTIPAGETQTFEFKPIIGRYVNIVIPGRKEYLHVCEVEVYGEKYPPPSCPCAPKNLALQVPAVQSSTYKSAEAKNAVDGDRNSILSGGSCSHTDVEMSPWWRADLLDVHKVSRVSITNRGDCCAETINGAQIRIGDSLDNNGNNNQLAATVDSIPAGATQTFKFNSIKGRYVNIVIPDRKEYLTLCEVEVFAEKDRPTYTCAPRNLALGATTVQISTYEENMSQKAVDGRRDSCSHTKSNMSPWWRVNLLDVYQITRVIITNRVDAINGESINGTQIRIGNSLENDGNNNQLAATVDFIPAGETKTFDFNRVEGQYVNIFIPDRKQYLSLCEVEVYAD